MVVNFTKGDKLCYISLAELSKGEIKGYLYEKHKDVKDFIFQDHLLFKDKAEIIAYLRTQDPNLDLDKYINFRDTSGDWIIW